MANEFFLKSRPQVSFETVWTESFDVTQLIWQMVLAAHATDSEPVKESILSFLREKSGEMIEIEERLFKTRGEIGDLFYRNFPDSHQEEWFKFADELGMFQNRLNSALMRLFLLKDVLLQIEETHPKRQELEEALKRGLEGLRKARQITDTITMETEASHRAVFEAIVLARAIGNDVPFEEAEKLERKRWE